MAKSEYCIMPDNPPWWRNYEAIKAHREKYHRHEVFSGANRRKSIEDGLVIFLTPQQHNMGNEGIHFNKPYNVYAKQIAQTEWERLRGTRSDFITRYGKSYL